MDNNTDDILLSTTTFDDTGYIRKSLISAYDFSKRKLFSFYGYLIIMIIFLLIVILLLVIHKHLNGN